MGEGAGGADQGTRRLRAFTQKGKGQEVGAACMSNLVKPNHSNLILACICDASGSHTPPPSLLPSPPSAELQAKLTAAEENSLAVQLERELKVTKEEAITPPLKTWTSHPLPTRSLIDPSRPAD